MKKLFLLLFFFPMLIYSQTKTITGTVIDSEGAPLPGASIVIKGTSIGASTDFDGKFTIDVPNVGKTLVVSYVGFSSKEIKIDTVVNFTIQLEADANTLDEVVVVGYGTVLRKDVTGALSSVKVSENVAFQSTTVDQLLQGRAAGVQVISNGSALGAGLSVKIRGTNSLRGNNEPLYVVDGIIVASAGEDVLAAGGIGNSGQESQSGLNGINANDIESMEVLKDASATAIYGSRGANGVVLITTKKGKNGKAKISGFHNSSVRSITKKWDVLDGPDFAHYRNEAANVNNADVPYHIEGSDIYGITYNSGIPTISDTPAKVYNWQDELYKQGFGTKLGLTASGGNDNGNYYVSAGYDNQEGVVKSSGLETGNLRVNLNQDLTSKLRLEASVSATITNTDFAESGDLIGNNQSFIRNVIAFRPVITEDVDNFAEDLEASNPYSWVDDFSDISKENRYFGSLGLTYEFGIKGLTYQLKAGGNIRTKDRRRFYGLTTFQGSNANGALQISTLNNTSYQINNTLNFNRTFKNKHRINAMIGVTWDARKVNNSIYAVEDFVTTELTTDQPFLGSVITQPLQFFNADQQILSFLGRLNYTFNNKYVFTTTFRGDGVSKFSQENRFGFFPSFAFAWRLNNEKFIKNLNFFEDLKLRAGWGQIGNHGISPYGTLSNYGVTGSLYGTASGGTSVALGLNNVANPDLTWETTEQLNFGLDFATKNNRVSGSIDVYDKSTIDLLQNAPIPASAGFGSILVNRGTISNKGLELTINWSVIENKDIQLNVGGNIAFNKSKIEYLGIPLSDFYIDGIAEQRSFYFGNDISRGNIFKYPANVFVEGEELSLFYGYATDGIYQTDDTDIIAGSVPGDVRIVDQNGDGTIDLKDRTFIGNPNPDIVYGINLSLKIKRFTATMLFTGVSGNDIANGNLLQIGTPEGENYNIIQDAYDNAWRIDNASTTYPRIGYTTNGTPAMTDRIIEDGSFFRLNNVTVGYDIPVEKTGLQALNIYLAGQNLATWTKYSGYNPEVSSFLNNGGINGVDWNGAPNTMTILLGLNIGF
jgi:TonB-dependent starch-binding outer membrane protein SusC